MTTRRRSKWLAISAGIAILVGWLIYAAVLVYRVEMGDGEEIHLSEVQTLVEQQPREEWFAIYQHGRKAGYSHTQLRPQAKGYALTEEVFLRLNVLGEVQDVITRIEARLGGDFALNAFTFRLQAGAVSFRLTGSIQDGSLSLVGWMAGQGQSHQLPLSGPIYLGGGVEAFLAHQRLRVGETYRFAVFDPASVSENLVRLRVAARETIRIQQQEHEAFRVEMDFHGTKLTSWITPYGELVKQEGFLGLTMVKTDARGALGGKSETAVDLMQETAVVPDRSIARPRQLKRLRVYLDGLAGCGWDLEGGRQEWHDGELTVVRESLEELSSVSIPVTNPELAQDLQPSFLIQSDTPELKGEAAEIVSGERDALRAARRISAWVHRYVQKRPTLSIPNALEVWKSRAGDCNEHSVLFAALARAAGIPTRVAVGLLYANGRFFYHAWNEVYVGRWVALDALLDQVPADPTHIRLIIGGLERQVEIVRAVGRLGIRVLEYE
ncbi:MAG: transglutaminase-like domain-containing protein [Syntrophobacteria bacterium]